uniref:Uncharacterized protein ycf23 n=1 Tax=Pterocladia lucida TaxID=31408 RepID=A0A6M3WVX1_PTELU|nr:Ycf23 [Pterocladia lucida]
MTFIAVKLKQDLKNKKVIKIITGLSNFDTDNIIKTVHAAEMAGATYVDVSSNPKLVKILKSITTLPICVSSIAPRDLYNCLLSEADIFEIGNFDVFYYKDIYFSSYQIIQLVKEVKSFLKNKPLCVTIPYFLPLHEQVILVQKLQKIGVTMVQTEGYVNKNKCIFSRSPILNSTVLASSALSASHMISQYTNIPVIASSGINYISSPIAVASGASGIGIGSALKYYNSISEKAKYISQVISSVNMYKKNKFFPYMQTYQITNKCTN